MALSPEQREWFFSQIDAVDSEHSVVDVGDSRTRIRYDPAIRSDENRDREVTDEELVRALTLCLLASNAYEYPVTSFYIESNYSGAQFGHPVVGSSASSPLSWVLSCHSRWAAAGSRDRALDSACVDFSK
jgi:hypothetical protein